jgi:DNA helicase-2/ATP-dependent DNA helicase PcrA
VRASNAIKAALHGYEPSAEQWEAIEAPLEPVVIRAGAGSGKTAVMTARIVYLVETNQVRPTGVLGLTFTNKAAGELEERLSEALAAMEPRASEHPTVMTYHAFASKLLREHGPRIGIDPEAGLLSNAQKWQILLGMIDSLTTLDEVELRHPLSFIPQTLDLSDQSATHLVSPQELAAECDRMLAEDLGDKWAVQAFKKRKDFAKIIELYATRKRELRRIDYGDQIRLAVEILSSHPEVVEDLRERFPVVLLDEYQDTDPAQKVMLRHLCPDGAAVTAVGDARQAIYAWRGASMYNLINFHREFRREDGSDAHEASLAENYRSGRRIVELANRVIAKVPEVDRPGAELVPVPQTGEGWIGAAVFADQEAEARYIGSEINRLHGEGVKWEEMSILVRSRRYLDAVLSILEEFDIPFEMPDLGGLLKVPAVTDVIAWMQVLSDPGPKTNRWAARILMGPRFRIHYRDLAPITRWSVEKNYQLMEAAKETYGVDEPDPGEVAYSLVEALEHVDEIEGVSDEARARVREFFAVVEELRPVVSRGLQQLVQAIADRTGVADALAASAARSASAMRENLNGFIGVCSEFSPLEGDANLGTFLDFLDVAEQSEDAIPLATTAATDSVKVLTIHKAKGLEFDVVFVPHIAASQEISKWDGLQKNSIFPDLRLSNPLTATKQLPPGVRKDKGSLPEFNGKMKEFRDALKARAEEDERRLLYVGITRARKRLYCTAAHWYASEEEPKGPSAFLKEIRDEANADLVETLPGHCDTPPDETNPVVESMRRRLVWPPEPLDTQALPWTLTVDRLLDGGDVDQVLQTAEARALYNEHLRAIEALTSEPVDEPPRPAHRSLAATAAVRIAMGKEQADAVFHPLPQRPTHAQRVGIEVHGWIEERGRGLLGVADEDALEETTAPSDRSTVAAMRENYAKLGYEDRRLFELSTGEPAVEVPFMLKLPSGYLVRGRIDAVFVDDDGTLEIVDWKTGEADADLSQLELYAEALAVLGYIDGPCKLTIAYLRSGRAEPVIYTPRGLDWLDSELPALQTT